MSENAPRKTTLTIRQDGVGQPSVMLGGIELRNLLSAKDGLAIKYVPLHADGMGPCVPKVTMTFGEGAFDFDFDVDLLRSLLDAAEAADDE